VLRRLPIVGVFGRGAPIDAERVALARAVGAMVARLGAHLLTGGGYGVMAAAAEGFVAVAPRAGLSIGIVACDPHGPFDRPDHAEDGSPYPNPFVEVAVFTPLPTQVEDWRRSPNRNHVNVLTAHAIIALPGSAGTRNEVEMAAHYRDESSRTRAERRVVLVGPAEEFPGDLRDMFEHAPTVGDARGHLARVLAERGFSAEGPTP
jgi:predicted Rossmann-fold nucleotide-binding protein